MFKQSIKDLMQRNSFCRRIEDYWYKKKYQKWALLGKPIPPPHFVKQMIVKAYANMYGTDIFVETGTYLGEMVDAVKYNFNKIYSIELSPELYDKAENKFSKYKQISIFEGDSSKILPEILNEIEDPCLFWFDAHYSAGITARGEKETPVMEELKHIFKHPIEKHVILIDDARCFIGQNDYPALKELKELVLNRYPRSIFEVEDDIIRVHKKM